MTITRNDFHEQDVPQMMQDAAAMKKVTLK